MKKKSYGDRWFSWFQQWRKKNPAKKMNNHNSFDNKKKKFAKLSLDIIKYATSDENIPVALRESTAIALSFFFIRSYFYFANRRLFSNVCIKEVLFQFQLYQYLLHATFYSPTLKLNLYIYRKFVTQFFIYIYYFFPFWNQIIN